MRDWTDALGADLDAEAPVGADAEKRVQTPLSQFAARSFRSPSPYGTVLIMSPWNYPVLLTLEPLIDAIAAGNTAVVKPSAYAPATAAVLKNILEECFPIEYVAVITGGRTGNQALLQQRFDMIFFTGGKTVGREVLRSAAEYLTPVTLELGGKSPCIVDATAKIPLAARRIVFGKYLNCGQTCVAPDYVLCDVRIRDRLVETIRAEISRQFGENPLQNPDYGKIINEKHFHRLLGLMDAEKTVCGGQYDEKTLRIAPTVMTDVTWEDAVMGEEIFGPILPVLTYNAHDAEKGVAQNDFCRDASGTHAATGDFVDWAIRCVEEHPHPLALYFFSEDKKPREGSWITAILAAAASTTPSFTWPPAPCPSAAWVRAVWVGITAALDSRPSAIIGVLWIKRHGWICQYAIRGMMRKREVVAAFF